jgi:AAHS family 4-hydroxybenzoate transporter-like MFS transporter
LRTEVSVTEIIDKSKIGSFQIGIFVVCFVCLALDGFDVQSLGYVAPALSAELGITRVELGPVLSAAPFGVLFGSILCSILADRIGRRPVLIGATVFFAVLTLLTARAQTLRELLIVRAIGGIGMGAIMPNAMALVGEYSQKRVRVTVMMIVSNGFTAGAALGGFIAAWMLPLWGWRSVFYFGAVAPMLIAVVMLVMLPESIQFLTLQGKKLETLKKWLLRVDPKTPVGAGVEYVLPAEERRHGVPFVSLFADGRAVGTTLLWIVNFMNLLNIYFLQGWLTTVITDAGVEQSTAALVAAMVQVGGTVGAFTLGWFVHRLGFVPVLATCGVLACLNIALIGQPWMTVAALFVTVFIAGLCVIGGQAAINALSATYYPTHLRSTGVGAGLGVGRVGAIVGPSLASVFIAQGWTAADLFLAAAVPPLILAIVMSVWNRLAMRRGMSSKFEATAH